MSKTTPPNTTGRTRKFLVGGGIALVLVIALVFGGSWLYVNTRDDAPEALTESTETSSAPAALTDDLSGDWNLSTGTVGYRVKEVLFGQETEGVGRTDDVTGTLAIDGTTVTAADFSVDMTTLTSDSDRRDGQVNSRILQTSQYPEATFTLREPIELPSAPTNEAYTVSMTGDLTLHGVTKTVTADLNVSANGSNVAVTSAIPINFTDYNIDDPSFSGAQVEQDGTLELSLSFAKE